MDPNTGLTSLTSISKSMVTFIFLGPYYTYILHASKKYQCFHPRVSTMKVNKLQKRKRGLEKSEQAGSCIVRHKKDFRCDITIYYDLITQTFTSSMENLACASTPFAASGFPDGSFHSILNQRLYLTHPELGPVLSLFLLP